MVESLVVYANYIVIQNPIDESPMIWIHDEFSKNNWPNPAHQGLQKKNSLKYVLEKGKNVLDMGAHLGDYGITLAIALRNIGRTDIKVYCIEPSKEKCDFMRRLSHINNVQDNVIIICSGISDKIGKYSLKDKEKQKWGINTGGWQWTPDENGIEFTTLDILWKNKEIKNIGFFWLDAQWMEDNVFNGGVNFLLECKPYILMEYWTYSSFEEDNITVDIRTASPGTKEQLETDPVFSKIFNRLSIRVLDTGELFEDFLLEFN